MKFKDILSEQKDKIPGGLADNKSLDDIAKKHNVSLEQIKKQIEAGVKIELEHTNDKDIAFEIAKDHVFEDPEYYDKLKTIEGK